MANHMCIYIVMCIHACTYQSCGKRHKILLITHHHMTLLRDRWSSGSHPLIEGKHITYTCPPGFVLTGPNASVCTGNGEWEPDPGQVDCLGDCAQSQWCSMRIHLFLIYPSLSWSILVYLSHGNQACSFKFNLSKFEQNIVYS